MNGVLFGMTIAIIVLVLLLAVAGSRFEQWHWDREQDQDEAHAKCIAHISDVVSNRVIALVLRDLAQRWDSVEEKANLNQLARKVYKVGGPPMPTLWLNQQADLLDPTTPTAEEPAA